MRSDSSRQSTFQELRTLPKNTLVKLRVTRARDCEGALRSSTSVATSSSIVQHQRSNRRDQLSCTFRRNGYTISSKRDLGETAPTASTPKKYPDSTRRIGPVTRICSNAQFPGTGISHEYASARLYTASFLTRQPDIHARPCQTSPSLIGSLRCPFHHTSAPGWSTRDLPDGACVVGLCVVS